MTTRAERMTSEILSRLRKISRQPQLSNHEATQIAQAIIGACRGMTEQVKAREATPTEFHFEKAKDAD